MSQRLYLAVQLLVLTELEVICLFVRPFVPCLRFSRNRKAMETSHLVFNTVRQCERVQGDASASPGCSTEKVARG